MAKTVRTKTQHKVKSASTSKKVAQPVPAPVDPESRKERKYSNRTKHRREIAYYARAPGRRIKFSATKRWIRHHLHHIAEDNETNHLVGETNPKTGAPRKPTDLRIQVGAICAIQHYVEDQLNLFLRGAVPVLNLNNTVVLKTKYMEVLRQMWSAYHNGDNNAFGDAELYKREKRSKRKQVLKASASKSKIVSAGEEDEEDVSA